MNLSELLSLRQNYPLWMKEIITKDRIRVAIDKYGPEGLYVAFSGGKDSTILHHLVKEVELSMYGKIEIPRVFVDTGLEYPELKKFVNDLRKEIGDLLVILRPTMSFKQVIEEYGYPIITKSQAFAIYKLRHNNLTDAYRNKLLYGDEKGTAGKLSNKWHYLLDAPFEISNKCCEVMKKRPFHKYERETNRIPFTGEMACESQNRRISYVKDGGCNAFDSENPKSKPLSIWTEQNALEYIYENDIEIAPPYGQIEKYEEITLIETKSEYKTTGEDRLGCIFCGFGCHLENGENRFQRLKKTHPQLHKYCMDQLGMREVLKYINVKCE